MTPREIRDLRHRIDRLGVVSGQHRVSRELGLLTLSPSNTTLEQLVQNRIEGLESRLLECPFVDPLEDAMPALEKDRIPLCSLRNDVVVSIGVGDLCKNMLLIGPTGSGKTNALRLLITALLEKC